MVNNNIKWKLTFVSKMIEKKLHEIKRSTFIFSLFDEYDVIRISLKRNAISTVMRLHKFT